MGSSRPEKPVLVSNADAWASYRDFTSDLSKNARQLGVGAVAVCWFFKTSAVTFPERILWALLAAVGFFVLDGVQYLVAAIKLRRFIERRERELGKDVATGDYALPAGWDSTTFKLFLVKLGLLFLSFAFIAWELASRISTPVQALPSVEKGEVRIEADTARR